MNFSEIKKNEPPAHVMEAWRRYEIETGDIMTREQMATLAALLQSILTKLSGTLTDTGSSKYDWFIQKPM